MPRVARIATPLEKTIEIDNQRPSVPRSSEAPSQGGGKVDKRAEGAKNLWVRTGCHWNMKICTYNARSLSFGDRILEF